MQSPLPVMPCRSCASHNWAARPKKASRGHVQALSPGMSAKAPVAAHALLLTVLPCRHIRDIHAKDLANPAQQPDYLILAGPQV